MEVELKKNSGLQHMAELETLKNALRCEDIVALKSRYGSIHRAEKRLHHLNMEVEKFMEKDSHSKLAKELKELRWAFYYEDSQFIREQYGSILEAERRMSQLIRKIE